MNDITLEQAQAAVEAAKAKAAEINTLMDIAVVDAGANLKAFVRMDVASVSALSVGKAPRAMRSCSVSPSSSSCTM